jgi:hypothetical protein
MDNAFDHLSLFTILPENNITSKSGISQLAVFQATL